MISISRNEPKGCEETGTKGKPPKLGAVCGRYYERLTWVDTGGGKCIQA